MKYAKTVSVTAIVMAMAIGHAHAQGGTWTATGSLGAVRSGHTATLLTNGKVLVTGGISNVPPVEVLTSSELYDPATGVWTATGSLGSARSSHTATLLTSGKVLVAGGYYGSGAELYDPATGTWTPTGSLNRGRLDHTATLLPSGKVLVAGGDDSAGAVLAAELYDPGTGTWTVTGDLHFIHENHTATLLPNGEVLVASGASNNYSGSLSAELYDPETGTWTLTGAPQTARAYHTATLLSSGKVLVAGGEEAFVQYQLSSAELYDPGTGTWSATGDLGTAREWHTATPLASGRVLITGGLYGTRVLSSSELYDPGTGVWTATGDLGTEKMRHTATLLATGNVLVAGGDNEGGVGALASAELYEPPAFALIQQPINPDGSSVFNVNRGVVPVKFKLTQNGVSTCQMPAATISLVRTAGAVTGSIDESIYIQSADSGATFRVDSGNCQYVYNLNTQSLGTGTYVVSISIGGSSVGSGTFGLK